MNIGDYVNRNQTQNPTGAVVADVQPASFLSGNPEFDINLLLTYDEGGWGWWPIGSVTYVAPGFAAQATTTLGGVTMSATSPSGS